MTDRQHKITICMSAGKGLLFFNGTIIKDFPTTILFNDEREGELTLFKHFMVWHKNITRGYEKNE